MCNWSKAFFHFSYGASKVRFERRLCRQLAAAAAARKSRMCNWDYAIQPQRLPQNMPMSSRHGDECERITPDSTAAAAGDPEAARGQLGASSLTLLSKGYFVSSYTLLYNSSSWQVIASNRRHVSTTSY